MSLSKTRHNVISERVFWDISRYGDVFRKKLTRNQTYQKNELKLYKIICKHIARRPFFIRVKDLHRKAGISKPAFYFHHRNCASVRDTMESTLHEQFRDDLQHNYEKKTYFLLLVEFVARNQPYFHATMCGSDHYLLTKILLDNRDLLVSKNISARACSLYVRNIQAMVDNWLEFEEITDESIKQCAKQLERIRVVNYW